MSGQPRDRERALVKALVLTLTYLAAEVIGGVWTHSLALLADAGHMLTDVAGLALALFAIRFARQPATAERTYGYHRAEILAAVANAVVLLGISGLVLYEAYSRFWNPPEVHSGIMLLVASVGLVVNALSLFILRDESDGSLNVKGAYFEVLSDFVTSIGVIVGAVVIWLTGWNRVDAIISAGIGLFIVPRTWLLLREGIGVLLEGTPAEINLDDLRRAITTLEGIKDVHDLHVWALTSGVNAMSAHVVADPQTSASDILSKARDCATKDFKIAHVTIQVEPTGWRCEGPHL